MTTLGSSVQPVGNLLHAHDLYDHLRAVPPAIAPHADPLTSVHRELLGGVLVGRSGESGRPATPAAGAVG